MLNDFSAKELEHLTIQLTNALSSLKAPNESPWYLNVTAAAVLNARLLQSSENLNKLAKYSVCVLQRLILIV